MGAEYFISLCGDYVGVHFVRFIEVCIFVLCSVCFSQMCYAFHRNKKCK